jgi:hypothetical protein
MSYLAAVAAHPCGDVLVGCVPCRGARAGQQCQVPRAGAQHAGGATECAEGRAVKQPAAAGGGCVGKLASSC